MITEERIGALETTVLCASTDPQGICVICHGFGAPGNDLVPVVKQVIDSEQQLQQFAFVFPKAPIELDPYFDSRAWWMIDVEKIQSLMLAGELREMRNEVPVELESCRRQITQLISELMDRFELPSEKVVVGGFSQGAMLMTDVALNYPGALGGLIVWSGTLINENAWRTAAENQLGISILQTHGRLDPLLPFAGAELLRDLFVEFDHQVKFLPFDGAHTIEERGIEAAGHLLRNVLNA